MSSDKRLRDLVRFGTLHDVQVALESLAAATEDCCAWIEANRPRTAERVILVNILTAVGQYVRISKPEPITLIPVIALGTRGVFELDLRLRRILKSKEHYRTWEAEAASDRIQIFESLIQLSPSGQDPNVKVLEGEIQRVKALLSKHGLPYKVKPPTVADLAKEAGVEDEYRAFYKLFSKLVHPSSWLINDTNGPASPLSRDILLINLQLYAWDALTRIKHQFSVPDSVILGRSGGERSNTKQPG